MNLPHADRPVPLVPFEDAGVFQDIGKDFTTSS